jgi:Protein of unknown function (DUF2844)
MSRRPVGSIKSKMLVMAAVWAALSGALPAFGALGGDVASIEADRVRMQGTRRTMAAQTYSVHEIQAASGTVVREYASSDGKVFAVAFQGRWQPDMRQILGSYFDQYYRAVLAQGIRRGRRPVVIDEPGLSVRIGGHLGSFAGRAYVPEKLPSGVRAEDIQ